MGSDKTQLFERQSYTRLLKYAAPYKYRLAVGILAGFVVGGSLFGSLMLIPQIMMGIDPGKQDDSQEQLHQTAVKINQTLKEAPADTNDIKRVEAIKEHLKPKSKDRITEGVQKIRKVIRTLHLPAKLEYANGDITLTSSLGNLTFPAETADGKMTSQFFAIFVLGFILMWGLKNLATYINRYYTRWVGTKVVADLREEVFHKLMSQSLRFYGKQDIGQLISRCTNDTAAIETAVAHTIADATRCPLEILACVGTIIYASLKYQNYALPLILFVGLPVCVLPIILIGRVVRKVYQKAYAKIADVVSRMHEVFTGILVVKAYHAEAKETGIFKDTNRKYFRTVVRALKAELLMAPTMETVAVTATLVFLIYSHHKGISLEQLSMLLIPAFMAYQPIKKLAKIFTYIQRSMAAADRYFNLIDTDTSVKEHKDPIPIEQFQGEIAFKNVDFEYEPGKKILDGMDLTIKKGQVVAVVGETGSGKTTIANLIARFYDVNGGTVSIDGQDVRDLKISSLRDLIGIVTQDAILFNDTIASNIAYGCPDAKQEAIEEAAKQANAHQFIVNGGHAEGYKTVVGEKGCILSGGEKQRVSIARAILKNPPILILDEATSALDTVTERLVQEALNNLMENRTVFAIAHRLSTIRHADLIIVLDKGHIIERGTHDELLAQNGVYKKLHDTQFMLN